MTLIFTNAFRQSSTGYFRSAVVSEWVWFNIPLDTQ